MDGNKNIRKNIQKWERKYGKGRLWREIIKNIWRQGRKEGRIHGGREGKKVVRKNI